MSPKKSFTCGADLKRKINWFRNRLKGWFHVNSRKFPWRDPERTPYEILIAEILLRRTRAGTVAPIYLKFLRTYPNFKKLSTAARSDLQNLIKPLGLWRQKTPILLTVAKAVQENRGQLPSSRSELEALYHIGDYIASVVLTTVHGKSEPFVDVNMARVVDRFFGARKLVDIRYDPYLHSVARHIVNVSGKSLELNWAVLDFAALVCKAGRPRCEICPMTAKCLYFQTVRKD